MPSTAVRFVNLLSSRDEIRILLDGNVVVGNSLTGEVSDFAAVEPGAHRVKVVPCYGKGVLLESSFQVAPSTKTSLVLAGGPSKAAPTAAATVLPLVHSNASAPPPAPGQPPACTLIFVNCDQRGPIKVGLKSGGAGTSFDLPPGKSHTIQKCPVAELELTASPLFKLANGETAAAMLNAFSPAMPTTYYCVFYAVSPNHPTRSVFLATDANGDLGQSVVNDR